MYQPQGQQPAGLGNASHWRRLLRASVNLEADPLVRTVFAATCDLTSLKCANDAQRRAGVAPLILAKDGLVAPDTIGAVTSHAIRGTHLLKLEATGGFSTVFQSVTLAQFRLAFGVLPMAQGYPREAEQVLQRTSGQVMATKLQTLIPRLGPYVMSEHMFDMQAASMGLKAANKSVLSSTTAMPATIFATTRPLERKDMKGGSAAWYTASATFPLASHKSLATYLRTLLKTEPGFNEQQLATTLAKCMTPPLHMLGKIHGAKGVYRDVKLENMLVFRVPGTSRTLCLLADSALARGVNMMLKRTHGSGTPGNLGFKSMMGCNTGSSDQDHVSMGSSLVGATTMGGLQWKGAEFCTGQGLAEELAASAAAVGWHLGPAPFLAGGKVAHDVTVKLDRAGHTPVLFMDYTCLLHQTEVWPRRAGQQRQQAGTEVGLRPPPSPPVPPQHIRVAAMLVAHRALNEGKAPRRDVGLAVSLTSAVLDKRIELTLEAAQGQQGAGGQQQQQQWQEWGGLQELAPLDEAQLRAAEVVQAALATDNPLGLYDLESKRTDVPLRRLGPDLENKLKGRLAVEPEKDAVLGGPWRNLQTYLNVKNSARATPTHMIKLCVDLLLEVWQQGTTWQEVAVKDVEAALVRVQADPEAIPHWMPAVVLYRQCVQLLSQECAGRTGRLLASFLPLLFSPCTTLRPKFGDLAQQLVASLREDGAGGVGMLSSILDEAVDLKALSRAFLKHHQREVLRHEDPTTLACLMRDHLARQAREGAYDIIADRLEQGLEEGGFGVLWRDPVDLQLHNMPQEDEEVQRLLDAYYTNLLGTSSPEAKALLLQRHMWLTHALIDILQRAQQAAWRTSNDRELHGLVVDALDKSPSARAFVDSYPDCSAVQCTRQEAGEIVVMMCMHVLSAASHYPVYPGTQPTTAQLRLVEHAVRRILMGLLQSVTRLLARRAQGGPQPQAPAQPQPQAPQPQAQAAAERPGEEGPAARGTLLPDPSLADPGWEDVEEESTAQDALSCMLQALTLAQAPAAGTGAPADQGPGSGVGAEGSAAATTASAVGSSGLQGFHASAQGQGSGGSGSATAATAGSALACPSQWEWPVVGAGAAAGGCGSDPTAAATAGPVVTAPSSRAWGPGGGGGSGTTAGSAAVASSGQQASQACVQKQGHGMGAGGHGSADATSTAQLPRPAVPRQGAGRVLALAARFQGPPLGALAQLQEVFPDPPPAGAPVLQPGPSLMMELQAAAAASDAASSSTLAAGAAATHATAAGAAAAAAGPEVGAPGAPPASAHASQAATAAVGPREAETVEQEQAYPKDYASARQFWLQHLQKTAAASVEQAPRRPMQQRWPAQQPQQQQPAVATARSNGSGVNAAVMRQPAAAAGASGSCVAATTEAEDVEPMAWSQRTTQLLEDVCTAAVQALTSASGGLGLTRGASAPGHAASSGGQWVPLAGGVTALSSPAHSVRQSLFGSSADSGGAVGPGERDTELVEEDFSLRQRVMGRMFRATSRKADVELLRRVEGLSISGPARVQVGKKRLTEPQPGGGEEEEEEETGGMGIGTKKQRLKPPPRQAQGSSGQPPNQAPQP